MENGKLVRSDISDCVAFFRRRQMPKDRGKKRKDLEDDDDDDDGRHVEVAAVDFANFICQKRYRPFFRDPQKAPFTSTSSTPVAFLSPPRGSLRCK